LSFSLLLFFAHFFSTPQLCAQSLRPAAVEPPYTIESYITLINRIVDTNGAALRIAGSATGSERLANDGVCYVRALRVRPSRSVDAFLSAVRSDLFQSGFLTVERCVYDAPAGRRIDVTTFIGGAPVHILRVYERIAARVAFVIDDVGYSEQALPDAIGVACPVTFAVLPHLAFSQKTAETLDRHGFEIMLHLPMESSRRSVRPEKGTITSRMSDGEISERLDDNLAAVPYVKGVNNHMGSLATKDERVMEAVLRDLKRRGFFYVDSVTVGKSAAWSAAERVGLQIKGRDVFLDNKHKPAYIRSQLGQLKAVALERKEAIGIGHFFSVTLQAIEEMRPAFEDADIKIVFVSELFKRAGESNRMEKDEHTAMANDQ